MRKSAVKSTIPGFFTTVFILVSVPQAQAEPSYPPRSLAISLAAGAALGTIPSETDKRLHYWAGHGISSLTAYTLSQHGASRLWASAGGFLAGVAAGALKESYDHSKGGPWDTRDFAATAIGAAGGVLTLNLSF